MREHIKELFVNGMSINDICTSCNISRTTFYNNKKADFLKTGISWEELKLAKSRNPQNIKEKEAIFLNSLCNEFEKYLKSAKDGELSIELLETLNKYAKTYWSIKAPQKLNEKEIAKKASSKTIDVICELVQEQEAKEIGVWLSANADEIIQRVSK